MAVSKFTSVSGGNDFNINVGSTYSVVNFTQEYAAGAYSFTSAQLDVTIDLYAYNGLGVLVGYTNGKGLITSGGFNKLVIIGGTPNDVLSFSYKTTYASVAETAEVTAGPVILSTNPTSLPNVSSSIIVTGLNFATDITATFTGTDNLVRPAKSLVRGSANSLVITRPDTFPIAYSPYTLTVANPNVAYQPTGSNSNTSSISAGVAPVWVTAAGTLSSTITDSTAYSYTLSATDADGGSSLSYILVSGALPTGLTLSTGGTISGTTGSTISALPTYSFTVRVTDSGGNFVDRSFIISNIFYASPTAAATASAPNGVYYFQGSGMSSAVKMTYNNAATISGGADGSGWVNVFSAPDGGTATVNLLDLSIPFTKLLVRAGNATYWGRCNFGSTQVYNTNTSGISSSSNANNFGGSGTKVMLGAAGAHGIFNTSQSACNWSTSINGAIGAGYTSARSCGTFPNGLTWGYIGNDNGPIYNTPGGTGEHWITW